MSFSGLFQTQGMLFLLLLIGYIFGKKGLADGTGKNLLTDLVIYVTLPGSIIKSFQIEFNHQILIACMTIAIAGIVIQTGSSVLGMFLYNHYGDSKKKVLQYATICSNAGILGNPIAEGFFGQMGMMYASIYVIPQRIFMWSVGLTYFTEAPDKKTLFKKVATHPCILSVFIGFFLMVTQIQLPEVLNVTIKNIAGANTFLAMALVGVILSRVKMKELVDRDTIYYAFIRLVFIPLLVYVGCKLAGLDDLVTGVSVVLAAMPAASTTAIIASKYKKDEKFATRCVVSSTLLSLVTVPVWCLFLV